MNDAADQLIDIAVDENDDDEEEDEANETEDNRVPTIYSRDTRGKKSNISRGSMNKSKN